MVSPGVRTVILVEGLSDSLALQELATRRGIDLCELGVAVEPMGGATNLAKFLRLYGPDGLNLRLAGLCDLGEEPHFRAVLQRAGVAEAGFFVCRRDLEDELIRALGVEAIEAIIEREGELESLRRLQQMPPHRNSPVTEHLHRFIGVRSGRKHRYAPLLVSALGDDAVPAPLQDVVTFASQDAGKLTG